MACDVYLAERLMRGTADRDVKRTHLVITDESLAAARVVRVERPIAVERLQRVTDRLGHNPGPELLVVGLPVGGPDEGQQVSDRHGCSFLRLRHRPGRPALRIGEAPRRAGDTGSRRGALGRIPGTAQR